MRSYGAVQAYDNDNKLIKEFKGGGDHFGNFIQAVRSRNPKDLNAEILEGHLSSALCHTGNISHRVGKDASVEDIRDVVKKDDSALEAVDRMIDHLAVANEVDLKATPLTLGPALPWTPRPRPSTATQPPTSCSPANIANRTWCRKSSSARETIKTGRDEFHLVPFFFVEIKAELQTPFIGIDEIHKTLDIIPITHPGIRLAHCQALA